MALAFTPSQPLTLGVELEIQLLDAGSRDLAPGAPAILERLGALRGTVRHELFRSMLEVATGICTTAEQARRELTAGLTAVREVATPLGFRLATAGAHPFARHRDRLVYPSGRYDALIDRNRWAVRRLMVFGLHVHVGMPSGDHAMAMINGLLDYLPHLLGLSASSPFWQGTDTGLASSRTAIFEALPTAGHPCTFADWADFERVYDAMIAARAITSIKDIWWDIRPHPDLGTVEVRVCDSLPTMTETIALVGLTHSLCAWLDHRLAAGERFAPPPMWMIRENKWRASRWGLDAEIVVGHEGVNRPLREDLCDLVERLRPHAERVGATDALAAVTTMLGRPTSFERQRALFNRHESLLPVADALIAECETDTPVVPG